MGSTHHLPFRVNGETHIVTVAGRTTLADLLTALSASSGRDLAGWAARWLRTSGISTLSVQAGTHDAEPGAVAIVQEAVDPVTGRVELRPHRLRVGSYDFDADGALVRTGSIETDVVGARTELAELTGQPRPALPVMSQPANGSGSPGYG